MLVSVCAKTRELHESICRGLHKNNIQTTNNVHKISDSDFVCITCYNRFATPNRLSFYNNAIKHKKPIVYIDRGIFGPINMVVFTINHPKRQGIGYVDKFANNDNRWKKISKATNIELISYGSRAKKHVSIVIHSVCGYNRIKNSVEKQLQDIEHTIKETRKAHDIVMVSKHPKCATVKHKTLNLHTIFTSKLCIGWNTNTLCEALIRGVPTVSLADDSFVYDLSSHSVSDKPIHPDRSEFVNKMGWANWFKSELPDGKMWPIILEALSI